MPRTARVMYLFNPPTSPYAQRFLEPLKGAASSIGVQVVASPVHDPAEIETVIAGFVREPDGGLIVLPGAFMLVHRDSIIGPASRIPYPARTIRRPPVEAALARTKCRKITGCKTTGSGADINDLWWGRVFTRSTMK